MDPLTFQSVMDSAKAKYMLDKDVLSEVPIQVTEYMRYKFWSDILDVSATLRFEYMRLGPH